jgi:hypothetical protein
VRPLTTDSGSDTVGWRPGSACSSRRFTSSHFARPRCSPVRRSDQPPRSLRPSSQTLARPSSSARSIGTGSPSRSVALRYVPASQTITSPAP